MKFVLRNRYIGGSAQRERSKIEQLSAFYRVFNSFYTASALTGHWPSDRSLHRSFPEADIGASAQHFDLPDVCNADFPDIYQLKSNVSFLELMGASLSGRHSGSAL